MKSLWNKVKLKRSEYKNINIAYVICFLGELYFPIAIWMFFYLRFLTFSQIALLTLIQLIVSIAFEVPSGALADIIGRKSAIILSYVIYSLVMLFTVFATCFWMFVVIDIFKGVAKALYSGSLEALVYDTLKENGDEESYDKVTANMETLYWVGLFLSAVLGGFIYDFKYQLPYLLQFIVYAGIAIISIGFIEPRIDSIKYSGKNLIKQNITGFKELFKTRYSTKLSILFITVGAGYFIAAELLGISQAREYGLTGKGVGLLFGTGYIISAIAAQAYPWLKKKFGNTLVFVGTAGIVLSSFLFAKYVGVVLGCALIISRIASSTTFRNLRSTKMNGLFTSKNRATALSTLAIFTKLPYAIAALTIGAYIDRQSPNQFAFVLGIIILSCIVVMVVFFKLFERFSSGPVSSTAAKCD